MRRSNPTGQKQLHCPLPLHPAFPDCYSRQGGTIPYTAVSQTKQFLKNTARFFFPILTSWTGNDNQQKNPSERTGNDVRNGFCHAKSAALLRAGGSFGAGMSVSPCNVSASCNEQVAYFPFHDIMQNTENNIRTTNTVCFDIGSGRISVPFLFIFIFFFSANYI